MASLAARFTVAIRAAVSQGLPTMMRLQLARAVGVQFAQRRPVVEMRAVYAGVSLRGGRIVYAVRGPETLLRRRWLPPVEAVDGRRFALPSARPRWSRRSALARLRALRALMRATVRGRAVYDVVVAMHTITPRSSRTPFYRSSVAPQVQAYLQTLLQQLQVSSNAPTAIAVARASVLPAEESTESTAAPRLTFLARSARRLRRTQAAPLRRSLAVVSAKESPIGASLSRAPLVERQHSTAWLVRNVDPARWAFFVEDDADLVKLWVAYVALHEANYWTERWAQCQLVRQYRWDVS